MELKEIQCRIMENKKKRGWNITMVDKEIIHITEEIGEVAREYRNIVNSHGGSWDNLANEIGDIIIYAIGTLGIMGLDAETIISNMVIKNETREYKRQSL